MNKVKEELTLYKQLKADIVSLELDIQEVNNESRIRDLSYSENDQTSPEKNIMDKVIETKELVYKKEKLELKIKRIDNALSVLSDRERQVITMLHIDKLPYERIEIAIDRSYSQVRNIANEGLKKLQRYF